MPYGGEPGLAAPSILAARAKTFADWFLAATILGFMLWLGVMLAFEAPVLRFFAPMILSLALVAAVARTFALRGRIETSVALLGLGILVFAIGGSFVVPGLASSLLLATVFVVALGISLASRRTLIILVAAAVAAAPIILLMGLNRSRPWDHDLPRIVEFVLGPLIALLFVVGLLVPLYGRIASSLSDLEAAVQFKSQFINTAAHELNTPLTPIRLQMHLLKINPVGLAAEQQRSLQILERNVDRLARLIQDVLDAARLQSARLSVQKKALDLQDVLQEAADSFRDPCREAGLRLEYERGPPLPVFGDDRRLVQVLYNLLGNALKFTPAGGSIRIDSSLKDGVVVVRVIDTGHGLGPEDQARLFQPFSQAGDPDGKRQGTGLGLYISRGIAELHGGRLWSESPGRGMGATFTIELPVSTGRPLVRRQERRLEETFMKRARELI